MSNITASLYFVGFYKHGALQSVVAGPFGSEEEAEAAIAKMDPLRPGLLPSSRSAHYVVCMAAGYLRPGKDESPQSGHTYEERQAAWDKWVDDHVAAARKLLEGK